jgi:hypothetical protein
MGADIESSPENEKPISSKAPPSIDLFADTFFPPQSKREWTR